MTEVMMYRNIQEDNMTCDFEFMYGLICGLGNPNKNNRSQY